MRRVAVALLAGLLVCALLLPWGGCVDTDPQVCTSMFGWYLVPSDPDRWVAWVAGAATASVVFLALWLRAIRPDPSG